MSLRYGSSSTTRICLATRAPEGARAMPDRRVRGIAGLRVGDASAGVALTCRVSKRRIRECHDRRSLAARRVRAAVVSAEVVGRLAGLVALGLLALLVLANGIAMPSGAILNFLHMIDLVFHEAGHVIFGVVGLGSQFIAVLGGSLNQVLVPAVCTAVFLRRKQYGSAAVTLFWVGQNLADVAVYIADGRAMALPLLAEGLIHDWNFILGRLGLLSHAQGLGRLTFALGALAMLAALALLGWDAWTRVLSSETRSSE